MVLGFALQASAEGTRDLAAEYELMVAPNGARLTRRDHPAVPLTVAELAQTARACAEVGASSMHLHVRDEAGQHTLDPDLYAEAIAAVTKASPIAVQISTEAVGRFDVATQIDCIARVGAPDVSIALREMAREPARMAEAYETAARVGSDVQHILYSADDVRALFEAYDAGTIPDGLNRALFVLGRYSENLTATPEALDPFLAALGDHELSWSVCAFGRHEQTCLLAALRQGGNVRIGFENNTLAPDGTPFRDNAEAVASLVEAAAREGFQPRQVS